MFQKLCLEWENLNLQVKIKHPSLWKCKQRVEEKKILFDVNGYIESGQLVAILGPSGAGKTTLLAAISSRYLGKVEGRILLNGETIERKTMTNLSCFVPQFNITVDSLTPNEHLYFMGELKLDRRWSRAKKNERIQTLVRKLGLLHVADTRICTLSGGERKRLNLATDLLTNPPIIFCDEPTTGLDSYNALSVVKSLQSLAQSDSHDMQGESETNGDKSDELELIDTRKMNEFPKAVLCSIHQPTSSTFQCFSHIILMYGGRAVFQGTRDEALTYFSRLGFHCPLAYNPSDYYFEILSDNTDADLIPSRRLVDRPIDVLRRSFHLTKPDRHLMKPFVITKDREHNNSIWLRQFWILLWRACLRTTSTWRQSSTIPFLLIVIEYIIIGALYHGVTNRTQESIQDVRGILFMLVCEICFSCNFETLMTFPAQMPLLRREVNEHIYKFSANFAAETLWLFVKNLLRAAAVFILSFAIYGFRNDIMLYVQLAITLILTMFTANSCGVMLSGLLEAGQEIATIVMLVFQLLGGFYINLNDFLYLRYISMFFYIDEALMILFWRDVTEIECPSTYDNKCLRNGTEVLEAFSYGTSTQYIYYDYAGLVCVAVIMNLIAFFGIRRYVRAVGYY